MLLGNTSFDMWELKLSSCYLKELSFYADKYILLAYRLLSAVSEGIELTINRAILKVLLQRSIYFVMIDLELVAQSHYG